MTTEMKEGWVVGGGEEYEGYPGALGGGEVRIGQDGTV